MFAALLNIPTIISQKRSFMNDLTRLRELAALFRPPTRSINENSQSPIEAFDGIKKIVEEAIEDLESKIGEDGALDSLLSKHNISDLDTFVDRDGVTMAERLAIRTKQYKREVNDIFLELELMLASLK